MQDQDILNLLSELECNLYYAKERDPKYDTTYTLVSTALVFFHELTGLTLESAEETANPLVLRFTVKRNSVSATQQNAEVYCNGEHIVTFGDDKKLIKPGEEYYGTLSGGCWGSKTPDAKFIHATLFHKYDDLYRVSTGVQDIIDREIKRQTKTAKRREIG